MKFFRYILLALILFGLATFVYLMVNKKTDDVVIPPVVVKTQPISLCFAKFGAQNERGFSDKYTLSMLLDGGSVTGELKFLPAEKDRKVGKFTGTVSPVDKVMMARTVDATWDTLAEGMNTKEQLKLTFGEGTASIGFGEMLDRGDGVYIYKDVKSILYNLQLTDVACTDLTLRDNIESYLRTNISTLSPVKAVLGGTWSVLGVTIDLLKSSGTVVYEDGHIQEKKNFSFTSNNKQEVLTLKVN